MASLRNMSRKNGTAYVLLFRLNGKQTSTSFEDAASAAKFRDLVDAVGPVKALTSVAADPALSTMTVEQWVAHYIEHRTGLAKSTLADYRSYAKHDINPTLGPIPLKALSRDDVAKWTLAMGAAGSRARPSPTRRRSSPPRSTVRSRQATSRRTPPPVTGCPAPRRRT